MIGNIASGAAASSNTETGIGNIVGNTKTWNLFFANLYLVALVLYAVWIFSGLLFYYFVGEWTWATSFFFALQAGLSIGFCAPV